MIFGDIDEKELGIAPSEVPQDVNPADPDDEIHYFCYDDWRDWCDAEVRFEEEWFIREMEAQDGNHEDDA